MFAHFSAAVAPATNNPSSTPIIKRSATPVASPVTLIVRDENPTHRRRVGWDLPPVGEPIAIRASDSLPRPHTPPQRLDQIVKYTPVDNTPRNTDRAPSEYINTHMQSGVHKLRAELSSELKHRKLCNESQKKLRVGAPRTEPYSYSFVDVHGKRFGINSLMDAHRATFSKIKEFNLHSLKNNHNLPRSNYDIPDEDKDHTRVGELTNKPDGVELVYLFVKDDEYLNCVRRSYMACFILILSFYLQGFWSSNPEWGSEKFWTFAVESFVELFILICLPYVGILFVLSLTQNSGLTLRYLCGVITLIIDRLLICFGFPGLRNPITLFPDFNNSIAAPNPKLSVLALYPLDTLQSFPGYSALQRIFGVGHFVAHYTVIDLMGYTHYQQIPISPDLLEKLRKEKLGTVPTTHNNNAFKRTYATLGIPVDVIENTIHYFLMCEKISNLKTEMILGKPTTLPRL